MATTDVTATVTVTDVQTIEEQLAQAVADMQRAIDQMQQQYALHSQALLSAIRGQWAAAQYGSESVESILVALNPNLQGKVNPVPFDTGR
jgi:hypothetical protein